MTVDIVHTKNIWYIDFVLFPFFWYANSSLLYSSNVTSHV